MVFKLLTLNVNKSVILAGILDILKTEQPDLVCLQEVPQGTEELSLLVRRFGYLAVASLKENLQPGVAIIYKVNLPVVEIQELSPGCLQIVKLESGLDIINIYAPSGNCNRDQRRTFFGDTLLRNLQLKKSVPILIGDFNCVINRSDTSANYDLKKCDALKDLINLFNYSDCLQVLHPFLLGQWTFSRPGMAVSRLDRVYIPQTILNDLITIQTLPTISDHKLVMVCLDIENASPVPRTKSPYWKLNVKVLSDPGFRDLFKNLWDRVILLLEDHDNVSDWWEITAKPRIRRFLQNLSRERARARRDLKSVLFHYLEHYTEIQDWRLVSYTRSRIRTLIQEDLYGFTIRSRIKEHAELEQGSLYHVAREVKNGSVTSFTQLKVPQGAGGYQFTDDQQVIEHNILSFYDSLFNGFHRTDPVMARFVEEEERYRAGLVDDPPDPVPASEPVNPG